MTIRACDKLRTFRFDACITTWLFRLTRRTLADRYRTERRRTALLQKQPPALVRDESAEMELRLLASYVRGQLGQLPARQREVFDLVDLQGFSSVEVADMLDLEEATVRVHLLRARRALRLRLLEQRSPSLQGVVNEL